jgi:cytochrome c-type biogenesis protein CcmH
VRRCVGLLRGFLLAFLCVGATLATAREAVPLAADEAVEQRLIDIASELRCPVCQNESLAVSPAALAQDLRRDIRTQIRQGRTDAEVVDFLVSRYGDFVLYRPPFKPSTWLLWGGPFAFLVLGVVVLLRYLSRRPRDDTPLSLDEQERAARLLGGDRTHAAHEPFPEH